LNLGKIGGRDSSRRPPDRYYGARGGAVSSDDGLFLSRRVSFSIYSEHGYGYFENDGIYVVAGHGVRGVITFVVCIHRRAKDPTNSHAEVQRVESRAQVNEEWVVDRSGKNADAIAEIIDSLLKQTVVARHGARARVARHRKQRAAAREIGRDAIPDHGDGIVLAKVQTFRTGSVKARDRRYTRDAADFSGEHTGQTDLGGEA